MKSYSLFICLLVFSIGNTAATANELPTNHLQLASTYFGNIDDPIHTAPPPTQRYYPPAKKQYKQTQPRRSTQKPVERSYTRQQTPTPTPTPGGNSQFSNAQVQQYIKNKGHSLQERQTICDTIASQRAQVQQFKERGIDVNKYLNAGRNSSMNTSKYVSKKQMDPKYQQYATSGGGNLDNLYVEYRCAEL